MPYDCNLIVPPLTRRPDRARGLITTRCAPENKPTRNVLRLVNQIANFESEPNLETYVPTAGVRILEFDREVSHATKRGASRAVNLAVELWDCSGEPIPFTPPYLTAWLLE